MSAAAAPALSLRGVEKTWRSPDRRFTLAVEALDLHPGEAVALTGESGSGKSTLLEVIALASRPDAAERFAFTDHDGVRIDAAALHRARDADGLARARAGLLGFVVQTGALLPFLTVTENAALAQSFAGRPDRDRIALLLERLNLTGVAQALPAALSVGQRQRAAIARALAHGPRVLLADEPTAALDPPNKRRAMDLFLDLAARFGAAVLVATHERTLAQEMGLREIAVSVRSDAGGHARATLEMAA